jgi:signal transduction histidine kinase
MDLHDGLGPTLAAIRLELVAFARHAHDPQPVNKIADQTSDAIREVRRIVDGLQPSILEDLGLVAAVQILVADTSRNTGIDFNVDAANEIDALPTLISVTAYRAIAESVANVARHSGARTCTVRLSLRDGHLNTTVADDGAGFDPVTARGGMGLQSIRARARAVGGEATVESTIGRGTVVSARLPVGATA